MSTDNSQAPMPTTQPSSASMVSVGEVRIWQLGQVMDRLALTLDKQTVLIDRMDSRVERLVILEEERQKYFIKTIWADVKAMALKAMEPETSGALTKLLGVMVVGVVVLAALAYNIPINIWGVVVGSTTGSHPAP